VQFADDKHREWAVAVEGCLGGLVGAFVLTSMQDKHTFDAMKKQLRVPPADNPVIVAVPHSRYNVQHPADGILTVERILKIDNDLAYVKEDPAAAPAPAPAAAAAATTARSCCRSRPPLLLPLTSPLSPPSGTTPSSTKPGSRARRSSTPRTRPRPAA